MIRLAVCLVLCSAAFAQHYAAPGAPSPVPMDFNDDIYNRDMRVQPSSNFIFNFEQARRDQPPQVEMREENIGKYMGRPRTTTPVPAMPVLNSHRTPDIDTVHLHHLSDKPASMKPYVPQQWDPVNSHLPATIPPAPTTPRWMDLSDDSFRHHSHHKPRRPQAPSRGTYDHAASMGTYDQGSNMGTYEPAPAPVPQWIPPAPPSVERMQQPEMSYSNPMPQYVAPTATIPAEQFVRGQARPQTPSRGSHKFSWDDVAMPQPAPVAPTTMAPAPAGARGPPPSIPTLTPWHDGFGK